MDSTKTILVVDDQPEIRDNLTDILSAEGYIAVGVSDGYSALTFLRERIPDLILCDAMMPGMNGFELVSSVRANPETASIPFIFLTALSERNDFRHGMDLGADDYLSKPWTIDGLLSAIRTRLRRQQELEARHAEQLRQIGEEVRRSIPQEMVEPLRGIIGYSDVLAQRCQTLGRDYVSELANDIRKSSRGLLRTVENFQFLLTLATHTEPLPDQPEFQPAFNILRDAAAAVAREHGREHDLVLRLDRTAGLIPPSASAKLASELLDNAFGFSSPGTPVEISAVKQPSGLLIAVTDNGCGLSQSGLLELRAVAGSPGASTSPASGTGWLICRELIARLGGRCEIESELGKGTTVRVWLPGAGTTPKPTGASV